MEDHVSKVPIGPDEEVKSIEIDRDEISSIHVVQVNPGREVKLRCHAEHEEGVLIVRGNALILDARVKAVGPGAFFLIRASQDHGFRNSSTGVRVAITGHQPPFDGKDRFDR